MFLSFKPSNLGSKIILKVRDLCELGDARWLKGVSFLRRVEGLNIRTNFGQEDILRIYHYPYVGVFVYINMVCINTGPRRQKMMT